jgi:hypothetical protein
MNKDKHPFANIDAHYGWSAEISQHESDPEIVGVKLKLTTSDTKASFFGSYSLDSLNDLSSDAVVIRNKLLLSAFTAYLNAGGTLDDIIDITKRIKSHMRRNGVSTSEPVFDYGPYVLFDYGHSADGNYVLDFINSESEHPDGVRWEHGVYIDLQAADCEEDE